MLSTILDVVVNVLHREVECLPLEAVVGGDLTDPVEEHQSHIGSELSLTAEDVQIRLLLLFFLQHCLEDFVLLFQVGKVPQ